MFIKSKVVKFFLFGAMVLVFLFASKQVFASITDGTIDSTYKYAWSENVGWINFGCTYCNVHITDSGLSGYAWSENYGWINLAPQTSGVKNDGNGNLSDYAWGESLGWINFSNTKINSRGEFTGYASSNISGKINFDCANCKVKTDWRTRSTRPACNNAIDDDGDGNIDYPADTDCSSLNDNDETDPTAGGGLPGEYYNPPTPPPSGKFKIVINQGAKYTNTRNVNLTLKAGSVAKYMSISEDKDFSEASVENYTGSKDWLLSQNDGTKTIYAKFYTQYMMASEIVFDTIILDTQVPEVKISDIKQYYEIGEKIILSGITEPEAEIILHWAEKYGLILADSQGKWTTNLGKLSPGKYDLELKPKDLAGNVGQIVSVFLEIKAKEEKIEEEKVEEGEEEIVEREVKKKEEKEREKPPFIERIKERIEEIFRPKEKPEKKPEEIVAVPEKAPMAFQGEWQLLPSKSIREFVLAPLPTEIRKLSQKFPELEKTLEKVGITKITDIEKLKTVKLSLPGLTERVGLPRAKVEPGKFALPVGIPVAELSPEIKKTIPSEIVFAKTGGKLIDFNIALSVTEKGEPQQTIATISGKPLQLVVKPDKSVKSIKGYVVFKSKEPRPTSLQFPFSNLTASLFFAKPVFAQPHDKPVRVEEKLVLLEFEYTDPDGDGIYTAEIQAPLVEGEYEIITVMDFEDSALGKKEIRMITVVDPEGYIYEKVGDKETRIPGAIVSLFWLDTETKQYKSWPAKEYQQENPQTTDVRGTYSFLVPEGYYYLKVEAPGYLFYDGKPFQVKEGSGIHINIELKNKYWWLKIVDWKTILLIAVIMLLLYNFYRDRVREKLMRKS